ncbi:unnamed protein product, partial [Owenia fusiformis]
HSFWNLTFHLLMSRPLEGVPEFVTGPLLLMEAIEKYKQLNTSDLIVYPPKVFNPWSWIVSKETSITECKSFGKINKTELKACRGFYNGSNTVTYHAHSWSL